MLFSESSDRKGIKLGGAREGAKLQRLAKRECPIYLRLDGYSNFRQTVGLGAPQMIIAPRP